MSAGAKMFHVEQRLKSSENVREVDVTTSIEAQRKAANFVHALDQYLGARKAVENGNPASLATQTRAFLVMATAMMVDSNDRD